MTCRTTPFWITIALVIGLFANANAQSSNVRALLEKVVAVYDSKPDFNIEAHYQMFKGLTGNAVTESYKGQLVKSGDYFKFKILSSEVVQIESTHLVINHEARQVIISKGDNEQNLPIDLTSYLEYFDKTSLKEKNGKLICEMVSTKPNPQFPYGKATVTIDKKNYRIEKQELYFTSLIPFVDPETGKQTPDYGRLVITMKENQPVTTAPELSDYIVHTQGDVKLTSKYANYHLIQQPN